MSTLNKKPFIKTLLESLTDEQISTFQTLIDGGGNQTPIFRTMDIKPTGTRTNITQVDKGVRLCNLQYNYSLLNGYLIYNDDYCVLIQFSDFQGLKMFSIDVSKLEIETIDEELSILELRSELDDTSAAEAAEIIQVVNDAIEAGEIEAGAVNVVSYDNVNISSGSVSKTPSAADWILMTDTSKDCVLDLYLSTQNVYPLGDLVELKRVSVSDDEVVFGATFDYPNNDTYINYTISAKFSGTSTAGKIVINEMEANKGGVSDNPLSDITLGGESYSVLTAGDIGADNYSENSTYAVGDIVAYGNKIYQCTTAVTAAEEFDATKWSEGTIASLILGMINTGV